MIFQQPCTVVKPTVQCPRFTIMLIPHDVYYFTFYSLSLSILTLPDLLCFYFSQEMVTVNVDGSVLDRIAKIMSYLRLGSSGKVLKKKKKEKDVKGTILIFFGNFGYYLLDACLYYLIQLS